MQTFDTIADARNAIMDFRADHGNELPEDLRQEFRTLSASPSPVDQIVKIGELLYARRADCCPEASALAASLVAFATVNGWHGLSEDGRGENMVQALRRDMNQKPIPGFKWPDPENDPAPLEQFAKAETPPAEVAAQPEGDSSNA